MTRFYLVTKNGSKVWPEHHVAGDPEATSVEGPIGGQSRRILWVAMATLQNGLSALGTEAAFRPVIVWGPGREAKGRTLRLHIEPPPPPPEPGPGGVVIKVPAAELRLSFERRQLHWWTRVWRWIRRD